MVEPRGHTTALVILLVCAPALAQEPGYPVPLRLEETIGSATHEQGASFALTVTAPVIVDGMTLIPAGAHAEGQVVHVQKPGAFGKPAELTLASRFVDVGDTRMALRGLMVAAVAQPRSTAANAARTTADVLDDLTIIRTTGSALYGTAIAAFIRGEHIVVPMGTDLVARVLVPEVSEHGTIVFYRPRGGGGLGYGFTVHEGTMEVVTLRRGEYFVAAVPPGKHEYFVRSEARDVLDVEVEAGETHYVRGTFTSGFAAQRPNLSPSSKQAFEALRGELEEVAPRESR
jgi:hypothetical protein